MIQKKDLIEQFRKIHGDKYDYSIMEENIKNINCEIHYICPKHGIVKQTAHNHLQGKGCYECAKESRRKKLSMSLEEFIEKSKKTHNDLDKYDWTDVDISIRDEKGKVKLKCKEHGEFFIKPSHFINGYGCQYCTGRKKDYEKLRQKLQEIHPTLDFSNTTFGDSKSKYATTYVCPIHGEKTANLYNLLRGEGCYECAMKQNGLKQKMKMDEFLEKSSLTHELSKYNFEKTDLFNLDEDGKITITCLKHGDFKILPHNFLNGHGCPSCAKENIGNKTRMPISEILKKEKEIFGNRYEILNLNEYKKAKTMLKIKCNVCGNVFESTRYNHINMKKGCPYCAQTSIEQIIDTMLKENNINYIYRAKKKNIPWIQNLEIDFFLPDYNIGIECQGGQHFFSVDLWGGEENLQNIIKRDELKQKLCEENNVKLFYYSDKEYDNSTYHIYTNPNDILKIIQENILQKEIKKDGM